MSDGALLESRTVPRFVGPTSLLGVALGVLAWTLPLFYGGTAYWFFLLPPAGLVLLVLPGPIRQFGAGLLASLLVWPFSLAGFLLMPVILGPALSLR